MARLILRDDVYNEDESTYELETYIAELTGHETALFAPSGTMTNQIAIRAHLSTPPHSLKKTNIKLHLDGARLWNACAETGLSLQKFTENFDSISICLSKGIGAPIGSVLVGIHVTLPVHTNMIFIDTKSINITTRELANRLASHNILISGNNSTTTRLVLHYQIPPISIEKFIDVVANIIKEKIFLKKL
ncbi:unnamed protein product [Rhizophagus irregularis]|nr:unnamed protein product [Rhizophagus irregularis]